ncbi:MAG: response regulator [Spirochaetaceae bacterium]|jgi:two-component system chemotaxis response regulator CheY|nr:response regulator [Spirochaetaceae bacterium]
MTILVVDDSKIMRNIVKNHFSELGYKCDYIEADNGMTALQLLVSHSVHLVLLDWNMPQLSGIEFLKKVRSMPRYDTLPIVMVTSEAARYSVVEALKCGATDYIIKPINERNFREKISKIDFSKVGKKK